MDVQGPSNNSWVQERHTWCPAWSSVQEITWVTWPRWAGLGAGDKILDAMSYMSNCVRTRQRVIWNQALSQPLVPWGHITLLDLDTNQGRWNQAGKVQKRLNQIHTHTHTLNHMSIYTFYQIKISAIIWRDTQSKNYCKPHVIITLFLYLNFGLSKQYLLHLFIFLFSSAYH